MNYTKKELIEKVKMLEDENDDLRNSINTIRNKEKECDELKTEMERFRKTVHRQHVIIATMTKEIEKHI